MRRPEFWRDGLMPGAVAGLVGGLLFGAAMTQLGVLPTIAGLMRAESAGVGFAVHMLIAAIVGAGFGLLVQRQRAGAGETLLWGLTYGAFWWFLGPLTLMPLLLEGVLTWDVAAAQAAFPSLLGHLWYGVGTALALVVLRRREGERQGGPSWPIVLGGAAAGLLALWLLQAILGRQVLTNAAMMSEAWAFPLALFAGVGYALLHFRSRDRAGAELIRGAAYGFFWWVIAAVTLIPLVTQGRLAWTLADMQSSFTVWPGYLLWGAVTAVFCKWLYSLGRLLFAEMALHSDEESAGVQGLQALARGAVSGSIGGLLFTLVMMQIGFLPVVAGLIGSESAWVGFVVHLLIANFIGISYGFLFRRQSHELAFALGWGVSYGFFWWVLGSLTLMPLLFGATPQWTVEVAAGTLPGLVGHLVYGAGLGITFHKLEARYSPWWIPRSRREEVRLAQRKEQLLTAAPALWTLVVVMALTLPVVLGA